MKPLVTMRAALIDPDLFTGILAGDSWAAWRILLIAAMGEALTPEERVIFGQLTGRPTEPAERVDELWCVIGRRGGKTRAVAVLGAYLASLCDWSDYLAPGERASLPIMSASTWQALKCKQYLSGIFSTVPALARLVTNETSDTISLSTLVDLEVRPANFRTARGGTCVAAIADEVAYWRSENSSNPDKEILDAVRPALATTGGLLACISSPYARRGELYNAWRRDYGPAGDSAILVAKASSRTMNPSLSEKVVRRAFERDAASASAEYGAEFRVDVEAFVTREALEACIEVGVRARAPLRSCTYVGFVDPSGGSSDSMTLTIAHLEKEVAILDYVREVKPPFSPASVVYEFAAILKSYRILIVRGDRYAGEWPREQFRKLNIRYEPADKSRSELYVDVLPLINSKRTSLLDNPKLLTQFVGLERRTSRAGRDSIDHAPGAHDDLANAVAGALVGAISRRPTITITDKMIERARRPIFTQSQWRI